MVVRSLHGRSDEVHDDLGGQPVGREGEPTEQDVGEVVQELDVQEDHPHKTVARPIDSIEMDESVQRRRERAIQPTTALAEEFVGAFWHVGFPLRCFDLLAC